MGHSLSVKIIVTALVLLYSLGCEDTVPTKIEEPAPQQLLPNHEYLQGDTVLVLCSNGLNGETVITEINFNESGDNFWYTLNPLSRKTNELKMVMPSLNYNTGNNHSTLRLRSIGTTADTLSIDSLRILKAMILEPNGGDTIRVGTVRPITWRTSEIRMAVTFEISVDTGRTFHFITSGAVNSSSKQGIYNWIVGAEYDSAFINYPSANCRLRLKCYTEGAIADLSDSYFTILK
jgi:hypothetical protein